MTPLKKQKRKTRTERGTPIDHSAEECPNFPGCHCVNDCIDGWKHPSPEDQKPMIYALAWIGAITVARWSRERWRTRKDKGYDASKWGAF